MKLWREPEGLGCFDPLDPNEELRRCRLALGDPDALERLRIAFWEPEALDKLSLGLFKLFCTPHFGGSVAIMSRVGERDWIPDLSSFER